jgi:hypothetical protein
MIAMSAGDQKTDAARISSPFRDHVLSSILSGEGFDEVERGELPFRTCGKTLLRLSFSVLRHFVKVNYHFCQ